MRSSTPKTRRMRGLSPDEQPEAVGPADVDAVLGARARPAASYGRRSPRWACARRPRSRGRRRRRCRWCCRGRARGSRRHRAELAVRHAHLGIVHHDVRAGVAADDDGVHVDGVGRAVGVRAVPPRTTQCTSRCRSARANPRPPRYQRARRGRGLAERPGPAWSMQGSARRASKRRQSRWAPARLTGGTRGWSPAQPTPPQKPHQGGSRASTKTVLPVLALAILPAACAARTAHSSPATPRAPRTSTAPSPTSSRSAPLSSAATGSRS